MIDQKLIELIGTAIGDDLWWSEDAAARVLTVLDREGYKIVRKDA